MKKALYRQVMKLASFVLVLAIFFPNGPYAATYPLPITDAAGQSLTFVQKPTRVVSLVPTATEILFALGCREEVIAVTYHDTKLEGAQGQVIVGGFFSPSLKSIAQMTPDLIIIGPHHKEIRRHFEGASGQVMVFNTQRLDDASRNIRLLGRIFDRESTAEKIIAQNQEELALIQKKVARIPGDKRKRVIRLMGREEIMTPGDDSFQNELIAAAGGIPPRLGRTGAIASVTLEEWQRFNPQVIYGCGGDRQTAKLLFDRPGWNEVDAVKNGRIYYFPCDLTCRAATHTGYFVSWLSSMIYTEEFAEPTNLVHAETVGHSRPLVIDLPYIKEARITSSTIHDFLHKTLIIGFTSPQAIVSTIEGQREGQLFVGNHFSPPPCWGIMHRLGLEGLRRHVYQVIGQKAEQAGFLFTGADMDNLAVKKSEFKDMKVYALVTAGVEGNAMRASRDSGDFYEAGTINIIILTNMSLSPGVMARAIISATEAKTAALNDMDIRSTYSPLINPATGTGTDNIIVVQGMGRRLNQGGGHTKIGELISSAVYDGVREAVLRQNRLSAPRDVFRRFEERKLSLHSLISKTSCNCDQSSSRLVAAVEEVLLDPRYAGFLESSFFLSDAHERGLIRDLEAFRQWSLEVAKSIAGRNIEEVKDQVRDSRLPTVIMMALNAVLTGVQARMADQSKGKD